MSNHYLSENFAPVHEEVTAFDLDVTGTIPAELNGRLLRNGPNPISAPDPETHHWFTGTGMVHGVRLRDGKAEWYRNRWVRDAEVAGVLGETAPPTPFGDEVPAYSPNTHVIGHAGRTFALVEAGAPPTELTDELDTIGPTNLDGTLEHPFSAHTKRDPATGELHLVAYYWGWGNRIRYMVIDRDARVRRTVDVDVPGGPMVHDCAITETSVVLFDLPCVFDLNLAMSGSTFPYRWDPDYGARVGVLPREGDAADVVWCDVEPCYVFHPLNAYDDDDGRVVIDVVRHPKMFAADTQGPNEGATRLDRWTIDPTARKVIEETLSDRPLEFPRHDERLVGRQHRFGYATGLEPGFALTVGVKHDLRAGTTDVHDYGPGRSTSELVFVPRTDDSAEDDGWLLSYVHDATTDRADVVILHAQDFTAPPIATIHLPARVPYGFHGSWIPTQ